MNMLFFPLNAAILSVSSPSNASCWHSSIKLKSPVWGIQTFESCTSVERQSPAVQPACPRVTFPCCHCVTSPPLPHQLLLSSEATGLSLQSDWQSLHQAYIKKHTPLEESLQRRVPNLPFLTFCFLKKKHLAFCSSALFVSHSGPERQLNTEDAIGDGRLKGLILLAYN